MAINDVLPLKAARRDAIANSKRFWGLRHQRPNFDGYVYINYAAPPYSARISAIYFLPGLATFGWFQVRSTIQNLRRVGKKSDPILSRLWTKVHKICRRRRKPLVLSNILYLS